VSNEPGRPYCFCVCDAFYSSDLIHGLIWDFSFSVNLAAAVATAAQLAAASAATTGRWHIGFPACASAEARVTKVAVPIRPRAIFSGAGARPTAAGAALPGVGSESAPSWPAAFLGTKRTQQLVVLPPTRREGERRKSRTYGRLGFDLENNPNSVRPIVVLTDGCINRMPVLDHPAVGISSVETPTEPGTPGGEVLVELCPGFPLQLYLHGGSL